MPLVARLRFDKHEVDLSEFEILMIFRIDDFEELVMNQVSTVILSRLGGDARRAD